MEDQTFTCAVYGGNLEIIKIVEQKQNENDLIENNTNNNDSFADLYNNKDFNRTYYDIDVFFIHDFDTIFVSIIKHQNIYLKTKLMKNYLRT